MYFYAEEGGTPTRTVYGCTLSPLGEYYFPPKLLTAAAMHRATIIIALIIVKKLM